MQDTNHDEPARLKRFGYALILGSLILFGTQLATSAGTPVTMYATGVPAGMGIGAMWVRRYILEVDTDE